MSSDSRCTCHNTLVVKDLNRWFKEKWVDVSRRDKDGKHPPCGRSKAKLSGKGYPKCRPSVKVSSKTPKTSGSMSSGQKRAATRRKRAKKQGVGGKPTIVKARNFNDYFNLKDQWVSLDKPNMNARPELYNEVASVMNSTYEAIGGHDKYKNDEDLMNEDQHSRYDMIDNDEDPFVDAAKVYSETDHGFKSSLGAHDGGEGKDAFKDYNAWVYQQPGIYGEASGGMANFLNRQNIPVITDAGDIRSIMSNKDITVTDARTGAYTRNIGGTEREKQIFGTPLVNQGGDVTRDHMNSIRQSLSNDPSKPFLLDIQTGEPMEIALQLLKEAISPEARRHKLEYDKQYEKTPERRKYQRELHTERRKRGIYGTGDHMDVSHTQGGRLTLEPEHANRARHFKDKGTLRVVKAKQTTLHEFSPTAVRAAHQHRNLPTMTVGTKEGDTKISRQEADERSDAMLAALSKLRLPQIISAEGGSKWTEQGDTEPSFTLTNVSPEQQRKIREIADRFGQEAIMYTSGNQEPTFRDTGGKVTEQYEQSKLTQDRPEYYTHYPGSNMYQTLS
jgi:hypothetical protein